MPANPLNPACIPYSVLVSHPRTWETLETLVMEEGKNFITVKDNAWSDIDEVKQLKVPHSQCMNHGAEWCMVPTLSLSASLFLSSLSLFLMSLLTAVYTGVQTFGNYPWLSRGHCG